MTGDKKMVSEQAIGQRQENQRRMRQLLRGVDKELFSYGPRRALHKLELAHIKLPRGCKYPLQIYEQWLTGLLERRSRLMEDNIAEMESKMERSK